MDKRQYDSPTTNRRVLTLMDTTWNYDPGQKHCPLAEQHTASPSAGECCPLVDTTSYSYPEPRAVLPRGKHNPVLRPTALPQVVLPPGGHTPVMQTPTLQSVLSWVNTSWLYSPSSPWDVLPPGGHNPILQPPAPLSTAAPLWGFTKEGQPPGGHSLVMQAPATTGCSAPCWTQHGAAAPHRIRQGCPLLEKKWYCIPPGSAYSWWTQPESAPPPQEHCCPLVNNTKQHSTPTTRSGLPSGGHKVAQ